MCFKNALACLIKTGISCKSTYRTCSSLKTLPLYSSCGSAAGNLASSSSSAVFTFQRLLSSLWEYDVTYKTHVLHSIHQFSTLTNKDLTSMAEAWPNVIRRPSSDSGTNRINCLLCCRMTWFPTNLTNRERTYDKTQLHTETHITKKTWLQSTYKVLCVQNLVLYRSFTGSYVGIIAGDLPHSTRDIPIH